MNIKPTVLKIRRPDDWHVHLRDGKMLHMVLPYTSSYFGRAIIMPNIIPPITTLSQAIAYRKRIMSAIPAQHCFIPLMTCYLTDFLDKKILIEGYKQKIFFAAKLYLANTTTNSNCGVINIMNIYPLFETMQNIGMPLLVHGEITSHDIDIFDREALFIEKIMEPIRQNFPCLKVVFEHISTKEASDYIIAGNNYLAATITPQHLMFNRNHMLLNKIKPHLYCLPILKRKVHQQALHRAVISGCNRLFLGTDTAPHYKKYKESCCGSAGIFNAPVALPAYATIFEEIGALAHFEAFCSLNGPKFHNISVNKGFIELHRKQSCYSTTISSLNDSEKLVPLLASKILPWTLINNNI